MASTGSTVTEIYCSRCDRRYQVDQVLTLCECGGPLMVDYDYQKAAALINPDSIVLRSSGMWKYQEVLPVLDSANIVDLGEGGTPLLKASRLAESLKLEHLYFKDETVNPTGSFKARGLAMAISKARELGLDKIIIPTAGNAGSAVAAYCARAGMKCKIIMPQDTPAPFKVDGLYFNAEIEMIDGSIKDCGARAAELVEKEGYFAMSTLKEPYRIEGKKTMGYELAEHFGFQLPEIVIYPTGGGTGLIGMWKAFDEMEKMGWIDKKRPKMVAVQAEGCAPIPQAYREGKDEAGEWPDPSTVAAGLRVPSAVGDFLMLNIIRESAGTALTVTDQELMNDTRELAAKEGILASPEGGATLAALKKLIADGYVKNNDRVVLFITGSGYKYLDILEKF